MVGRTDDPEFLQKRAEHLLASTLDGSRSWTREGPKRASTTYNVLIPEDGENYNVRMALIKVGSNGDSRYVLANHESGIYASTYKLRSNDFEPLTELGEAVFQD